MQQLPVMALIESLASRLALNVFGPITHVQLLLMAAVMGKTNSNAVLRHKGQMLVGVAGLLRGKMILKAV
jgi:hypothetical protein